MPVCPLCLHDNPPDAAACEHCGRYRFPETNETALADSGSMPEQSKLSAPRSTQPIERTDPATSVPTLRNAPVPSTAAPARLVVVRGQKLNAQFPIYEGANFIGRTDDTPADIDLSGVEPPEQIWSSRKHALIRCENGELSLEDLNSLNGTFVNRAKVHAGKRYQLKNNDVIQIGSVQLRVMV